MLKSKLQNVVPFPPIRPRSPLVSQNLDSKTILICKLQYHPSELFENKRTSVQALKHKIIIGAVFIGTLSSAGAVYGAFFSEKDVFHYPVQLFVLAILSFGVIAIVLLRTPTMAETFEPVDYISPEMQTKFLRWNDLVKGEYDANLNAFYERSEEHSLVVSPEEFNEFQKMGVMQIKKLKDVEFYFQQRTANNLKLPIESFREEEKKQQKYLFLKKIAEVDLVLKCAFEVLADYFELKMDKNVQFIANTLLHPENEMRSEMRQYGYFAFLYRYYIDNIKENIHHLELKAGVPEHFHLVNARKLYSL